MNEPEQNSGPVSDPVEQLRSEVDRLTARNRKLERENKAARNIGKGIVGAGAFILAGPRLSGATQAWIYAMRDWLADRQRGEVPLEETARLGAAILKYMFVLSLFGLVLAGVPIVLLFQQNLLLSRQNEAFVRDADIARRAQLIATLYDTDCSMLEQLPWDIADTIDGSDCPPRADVRSRAEAVKALYALDHPDPSRAQRVKLAFLDKPEPISTDLSEVVLDGVDLSEANLSGADLSLSSLRYAGLQRTNLSRAELHFADLSNSRLSEADLRGAALREADLSGTDLGHADLRQADLSKAKLSGADISFADLRGANISGADLSNTWSRDGFSATDLSGVDSGHAVRVALDWLADAVASVGLSDTYFRNAKFRNALASALSSAWIDAHMSEKRLIHALEGSVVKAFIEAWDNTYPDLDPKEAFADAKDVFGEDDSSQLRLTRWFSDLGDTWEELDISEEHYIVLFREQIQQQMDRAHGDNNTILPEGLDYPCTWKGIKCEPGESHGEPIGVSEGAVAADGQEVE